MILVDSKISEYISKGKIGVTPFNSDNIQQTSLDVTLGSEFKIMKRSEFLIINPFEKGADHKLKFARHLDQVLLKPGELLIAHTNEEITLPNDVCAEVQGKSTLARHGIVVHLTADKIHPGWRGQVVLEIVNNGPNDILLKKDNPIGTITFFQLDQEVSKPYNSRYQGQIGAQVPKS